MKVLAKWKRNFNTQNLWQEENNAPLNWFEKSLDILLYLIAKNLVKAS